MQNKYDLLSFFRIRQKSLWIRTITHKKIGAIIFVEELLGKKNTSDKRWKSK